MKTKLGHFHTLSRCWWGYGTALATRRTALGDLRRTWSRGGARISRSSRLYCWGIEMMHRWLKSVYHYIVVLV